MKKNTNILQGSLYSGILRYSIPIMLTGILQLMFNAADLVVVGQYCGSISLAAVSATSSITALLVNLFMGLSVGTGVSVAQALGSRNDEDVHRIVHTAIPTALICGSFLAIIGVIFSEDLLVMMKTPEDVLPLSTVYMQIYFAGLIFNLTYNFSASTLRAAGDTKSPLYFLTISGVINVVLNIVFVTAFDMNVAGVALATTISQGVSAVLVTVVLSRRTDACRVLFKKLHIYKKQLLKMIRIGLPAGIQSSLFSISNVFIQSSLNSFGNNAILSGNGAAVNLEGFVYAIMTGITQASVNYVGQNTGAKNFPRIKKIYGVCLIYVVLFVGAISVLGRILGNQLLSIYITDSPEAVAFGLKRMSYVMLPMFLCGMMNVTSDAARGLGASLIPMLISVLSICGIRFFWLLTIFQIPQYHTIDCLYVCYSITWLATFLFHFTAFWIIFKKKSRSYEQLEPAGGNI